MMHETDEEREPQPDRPEAQQEPVQAEEVTAPPSGDEDDGGAGPSADLDAQSQGNSYVPKGEDLADEVLDEGATSSGDSGEAGAGILFQNDRTTSEIMVQVGQAFVELSTRQGRHVTVPNELLEHVREVFVPPVGLGAQRENELLASTGRIFVVHGTQLSGKLTTCLHLAMKLRENRKAAKILFYRHPLEGSVPFAHHAQTTTLPEDAILIPEAALEDEVGGVDRWDLFLHSVLERSKSYLLLQTNGPIRRFGDSRAAWIDSRLEDLKAVFTRHLEYYLRQRFRDRLSEATDLAQRWQDRWTDVSDILLYPSQVDRFCCLLGELEIDAEREELRLIAKEASRPLEVAPGEALAWFRKLEPNHRLFALLLSLFQGLPRELVEEIYVKSVICLRDDGVANLRDPRELSFRDLLEAVKASEQSVVGNQHKEGEGEGGILFDDRLFGEAALIEVENHLPLLRSLRDPFIEMIERYASPEYWQLRKAVAEALGRIGAWRFDELFAIVDQLVRSPFLGAQVMAGNVLGLAFGSDPHVLLARERKLDAWIESEDPDQMFIAGTALWRVFDSFSSRTASASGFTSEEKIQDALFRILRKLIDRSGRFSKDARAKAMLIAKETSRTSHLVQRRYHEVIWHWQQKNLASVAYALRMIVRVAPAVVVRHIKAWSQEKEQKESLRFVLGLATEQIFLQEAAGRGLPLMDRLGHLVELVEFIFSSTTEHHDAVPPMMGALAAWCKDKKSRDYVERHLLDIANGADRSASQALRVAIAEHWLEETDPQVQKLGRALIARSVAVEGFPSELPEVNRCLLLVDASLVAFNLEAPKLARYLRQLLEAVVDVTVFPLGSTEPLRESADWEAQGAQPIVSARSRLMMPALELHKMANVSSVLALSWGDIVDLEDSLSSPWAGRLLVAMAGSKKDHSDKEAQVVLSMDNRFSDGDLVTIELQLNLLRARQLAAMPSTLWRPHLAKRLDVDLDNRDVLEETLRKRIAALQDPESMADPSASRLILCALLWLALEDLAGCCSLLDRWLSKEDKGQDSEIAQASLLRVFGEAGACMLFRLFACADPFPRPESHSIIFSLANRLVDLGWSSISVVLFALRCWLEDDGWRTSLLNGEYRSWLQTWLEQVAKTHHAELNAFLEFWREPLEARIFPRAGAPPAAVLALADEMALKIALARSEQLPSLSGGRRYAVIVVGSDCDDEPLRWSLSELAAEVVEQGKERLKDLVWLVYRCGRSLPTIIFNSDQEKVERAAYPEILFRRDEAQHPELLVPLLTRHDPALVRFVLLLHTLPILDELDLALSPWPRLLHAYPILELEAQARRRGPRERSEVKKEFQQRARFILQEMARSHSHPTVSGGSNEVDSPRS